MDSRSDVSDDEKIVAGMTRTQMARFTGNDPRCRGLELPEGLLLRYNLSQSLYFFLKTGVKDGNIVTQVFATDTPYDRQKALVGCVTTPMFTPQADACHLDRVESMLYSWVEFVKDEAEAGRDFSTFAMHANR
jgi:hypothetical protein